MDAKQISARCTTRSTARSFITTAIVRIITQRRIRSTSKGNMVKRQYAHNEIKHGGNPTLSKSGLESYARCTILQHERNAANT